MADPARTASGRPKRTGTTKAVPVWRPVRGGNAFEITVARLVQAIRLGLTSVGERLPPERELAERLRVSRVTLREAIRALREAGYLESRRGRTGGTFVLSDGRHDDGGVAAQVLNPRGLDAQVLKGGRAGSDGPRVARALRAGRGRAVATVPAAAALAREMGDSLHDALDFRRVVEPGAAGLAASRTLAAADRQHLAGCLAASRDRDPATRRLADSRLHLAIVGAAGSPSLAAAVADVQLTLDRLLAAIPVLRRNLDHSDTQHTRIVDAILAGDVGGARTAMEQHCDATAELLRGLLT
jgi:DNA-binding FadR family transcriptional regulator